MNRTCGDCVVCCSLLKIEALNKPRCTNCIHLSLERTPEKNEILITGKKSENNCTIYADRPEPCRNYECLWLQGFGLEEDRPDKSLVLFDTANSAEGEMYVRPVSPEMFQSQDDFRIVERFCLQTKLIANIIGFYKDKTAMIFGRPEQVMGVKEWQ